MNDDTVSTLNNGNGSTELRQSRLSASLNNVEYMRHFHFFVTYSRQKQLTKIELFMPHAKSALTDMKI